MLSELIEEFVDLKVAGAPDEDWMSIPRRQEAREAYFARLNELKASIDSVVGSLKE